MSPGPYFLRKQHKGDEEGYLYTSRHLGDLLDPAASFRLCSEHVDHWERSHPNSLDMLAMRQCSILNRAAL
jgi:hypothetical protein